MLELNNVITARPVKDSDPDVGYGAKSVLVEDTSGALLYLNSDDWELPVALAERPFEWLTVPTIREIRDRLTEVLEAVDEPATPSPATPSPAQATEQDSTQKVVIEVSVVNGSEIHVHQNF
jgi:hypothetical protein